MAMGTAFRAFFAALFNRDVSDNLRRVLDSEPTTDARRLDAPATEAAKPEAQVPPASLRSDAITLLAALQREARLIDLVQENLSQYSDSQIGAAARPCLQQCAATLDRLVALRPIETNGEGQLVNVPENAPPSRYQWIGEGSAATGKLVHHGWEASHVHLPQWTGNEQDARVIAPVQIQRG